MADVRDHHSWICFRQLGSVCGRASISVSLPSLSPEGGKGAFQRGLAEKASLADGPWHQITLIIVDLNVFKGVLIRI